MNDKKEYIVFFDLDRTILGMNSGYALGKAALGNGLMGKGAIARAAFKFILFKLKIMTAERIIYDMGKWLSGLRQETVSSLGQEAVDKYLIKSIYPRFYDELLLHKSKGAHTAILSSATTEICNPLAIRLGLDSVICTTMECINGVLTGQPDGSYCYGAEKGSRLSDFCNKNGFNTGQAWYYADSFSDIPALELSGNPVCINPDRKLRKAAQQRGWKISEWGNQGKN